jgi:hypothetical protein
MPSALRGQRLGIRLASAGRVDDRATGLSIAVHERSEALYPHRIELPSRSDAQLVTSEEWIGLQIIA